MLYEQSSLEYLLNIYTDIGQPAKFCILLAHRVETVCHLFRAEARGGFKEWPLVQWPTRPLPYGPRRTLVKINKNLHYNCKKKIFIPSNSVR